LPAYVTKRIEHIEPLAFVFQQLEELARLKETVALAEGVHGFAAIAYLLFSLWSTLPSP
jgi:hypothetical protein